MLQRELSKMINISVVRERKRMSLYVCLELNEFHEGFYTHEMHQLI
jgi:hypothetical protein